MTTAVTILATIKLAAGKTEADLLIASDIFEKEFVSKEAGVIRRELVRKSDNEYIDIVQFRSRKDMEAVMEKEKTCQICHQFFSIMDMSDMDEPPVAIYPSLATYP